jgi:hypothetical protein
MLLFIRHISHTAGAIGQVSQNAGHFLFTLSSWQSAMLSCSCLKELYHRSSSFDTPASALFGSDLEISAIDEHCIACSCSVLVPETICTLLLWVAAASIGILCVARLSFSSLSFVFISYSDGSTCQAAAATNQPHCSAATHPIMQLLGRRSAQQGPGMARYRERDRQGTS